MKKISPSNGEVKNVGDKNPSEDIKSPSEGQNDLALLDEVDIRAALGIVDGQVTLTFVDGKK